MTQTPLYDATARSAKERAFHALLFEVIAILISTPLFSYLMGYNIVKMGVLTTMVATIAVIWNFIYNLIFDRLTRSWLKERTLKVRVIHAILFEVGLILFTVPVASLWLKISLWDAFLLEAGILLFFLPYTVIFNWIYDITRELLWQRRYRKGGESR